MKNYENLLYDKIKQYTESDVLPMHMPGHKRSKFLKQILPYDIDITEIDGFDNLHDMQGLLKDATENAEKVFKVQKSYFLINGSSGGILSAIYSQTKSGDKVVVARNSHKAVYNALELSGLRATYIMPKFDKDLNINGEIDFKKLNQKLQEEKDVSCVVITSPTYEGIVSDIKAIADVCHKHNALLIVDEAHGAHLGFCKDFPKSARQLGADIVINSLHKTLPALTQCAILHTCSDRVNIAKLEKALAMFETSSPSYILMCSIDYCINLLKNEGKQLFASYSQNLDNVYADLKDLKHLKLINFKGNVNAFDFDKGKIIISTKNAEISGKMLAEILRNEYKIEIEMASTNYIIAMTSICDDAENLKRFIKAIKHIDNNIDKQCKKQGAFKNFIEENNVSSALFLPKQNLPIFKCKDLSGKLFNLKDCIGKTALEFIWLYPPGVPMLVSGEVITNEFVERLIKINNLGIEIKSNYNLAPNQIYCLNDENEEF